MLTAMRLSLNRFHTSNFMPLASRNLQVEEINGVLFKFDLDHVRVYKILISLEVAL